MKIRGLVKRTPMITPAILSFQWQRQMKDKFTANECNTAKRLERDYFLYADFHYPTTPPSIAFRIPPPHEWHLS